MWVGVSNLYLPVFCCRPRSFTGRRWTSFFLACTAPDGFLKPLISLLLSNGWASCLAALSYAHGLGRSCQILLTRGADPVELQRVTGYLVPRCPCRRLVNAVQHGNHHVVDTTAAGAAHVIVRKGLVIKAIGAVVDPHTPDLALVGELAQRAVDGRAADAGMLNANRLVDLIGGGVVGQPAQLVFDDRPLHGVSARHVSPPLVLRKL